LKCDCGDQLDIALQTIAAEGGMILYLRQEGRNIGLLNKVNAYALQDKGFDTVAANHQLGFPADARSYEIVHDILKYYHINKIKLLDQQPRKDKITSGDRDSRKTPHTSLRQINITKSTYKSKKIRWGIYYNSLQRAKLTFVTITLHSPQQSAHGQTTVLFDNPVEQLTNTY